MSCIELFQPLHSNDNLTNSWAVWVRKEFPSSTSGGVLHCKGLDRGLHSSGFVLRSTAVKPMLTLVLSAVNLVNSTTPHAYDLRTQTYLQPVFAFQTLQRLLSVNSATLATLQTQRKLMFEKREVPIGTSLTDLIGVGLKDPASAPVVLDALMTELEQQTK